MQAQRLKKDLRRRLVVLAGVLKHAEHIPVKRIQSRISVCIEALRQERQADGARDGFVVVRELGRVGQRQEHVCQLPPGGGTDLRNQNGS